MSKAILEGIQAKKTIRNFKLKNMIKKKII